MGGDNVTTQRATGSPLSEGIYVANDNDDQPVLSHIDRLVKEEEHLYGKSELTEGTGGVWPTCCHGQWVIEWAGHSFRVVSTARSMESTIF